MGQINPNIRLKEANKFKYISVIIFTIARILEDHVELTLQIWLSILFLVGYSVYLQ